MAESKKITDVKHATKPVVRISLDEEFSQEDLFQKLTPAVIKKLQTAHKTSDSVLIEFEKKMFGSVRKGK